MKIPAFAATFALAFAAQTCQAADEKQTPTDAFRGATQYHMLMCQIKEKTVAAKVELGEEVSISEIGDCIKKAKADTKKDFGTALKAVAKSREATKLLKDYYALWITAINGVLPAPGERKRDYAARQAAAAEKYDAVWDRFEVEAGL